MRNLDILLRKLQTSQDEINLISAKLSPGNKWEIGHPIEILRALDSKLPTEWNDWEPGLLFKKIEGTFGKLTEPLRQKVLAIQTAVSTNMSWFDYDVFENSCLAFCGQIPIWGTIEPLDLHEVAFGIGVLMAVREDEEFSDDVLGYIAATIVYNSLYACPPSFPAGIGQIIGRISPENRELGKEALYTWGSGVRIEDYEKDPNDALEAQLQKIQVAEDWLSFGKDFDGFILQNAE